MKRTIDLDQVRVIQADNYKGNSRVYLEIMDTRVLYTSPGDLAADELLSHHVTDRTEPATERNPWPVRELEVDTEGLADMVRAQLGHLLATLLLDARPDLFAAWDRDTDREIDYVKPRLEEDKDS